MVVLILQYYDLLLYQDHTFCLVTVQPVDEGAGGTVLSPKLFCDCLFDISIEII